MVPNVNKRGYSFKGVSSYLLFGDKNSPNPDRVAWAKTGNLYTDDIEKAASFMAWTDMERETIRNHWRAEQGLQPSNAGQKANAGNVYHYSLSWRDDQDPEQAHMQETVVSSLERLGLSEHQYFMVAHNDTDHAHVHVVVNLVHPETGKIANVYRDHKNLDRWAHEYEQEHGIVCEDRDRKYQSWAREDYEHGYGQIPDSKKERTALYKDQLTAAYEQSDSSSAFINAMQDKGLELALKTGSRRGFVFVDARGDIFGLTRHIDGVKTKEVTAFLKDVEVNKLTPADDLAAQRKQAFEEHQRQETDKQGDHYSREEEEAKQQAALEIAAAKHAHLQAALEDRRAEILKKLQIAIKIRAKDDWQALKERQSFERSAKEQKLRETDSPKEAKARSYYQPIIDVYEKDKQSLEQINGSWFQRKFYHFKNGQSVTDAIEDKQRSIDDAQSRLDASTGKLSADDVRKLKDLQRAHQAQRDRLSSRIDQELQQSQEQAEEQAIQEQIDKKSDIIEQLGRGGRLTGASQKHEREKQVLRNLLPSVREKQRQDDYARQVQAREQHQQSKEQECQEGRFDEMFIREEFQQNHSPKPDHISDDFGRRVAGLDHTNDDDYDLSR